MLPPLQCGKPLIGKFVSTGPSRIPRVVAFQGAYDEAGSRLLSTSVDNHPVPSTAECRFQPCLSDHLPSTHSGSPDGRSPVTYGRLQPLGHPSKCVTASSLDSPPPDARSQHGRPPPRTAPI
ncbi:hypothetical protein OC834_005659 [Tilletia horrida]|nr:hypothetical protein OC834_005659 [Tilletia horrida]